jgi:hypothetical protein
VDVTDVAEDEIIFDRLRTQYKELRGRWFRNPFVKPKAMHFVEVKSPSLSHQNAFLSSA